MIGVMFLISALLLAIFTNIAGYLLEIYVNSESIENNIDIYSYFWLTLTFSCGIIIFILNNYVYGVEWL